MKKHLKKFILLILIQQSTYAENSQFDSGFLFGESSNLDLTRFDNNFFHPGEYYLDIYLNKKFIIKSKIYILNNRDDPQVQSFCMPQKQFIYLDFRKDLINSNLTNDCIDLATIYQGVNIGVDLLNQRIDINSPQILLNERPQGYISPDLWENSTTSSYLKYNYNYYKTEIDNNISSESDYLSLYAGLNFGNWKYSHIGTTSLIGENKNYINNENKFLTTIPKLKSQLAIGDLYTGSSAFSNTNLSLRGGVLETEEQMLPSSMRNFAPDIVGFANTNALVRVRQGTQIIFERSVPAGAFNISDMYTPSANGTLYVDIIEATGEIRTFELPYNSAVQLLRPKQYRYQVALGKYRQFERSYNENVLNVVLEYGLTNYLTLRGASLVSDHYQSHAIGTSFNTYFGGVSLDGNTIVANLPFHQDKLKSSQLNFKYHWTSNEYRANLSIGHSHYFDENYYSFDDVMKIYYLQGSSNNSNYILQGQPRSSSYVQISKGLGAAFGGLNFSYSESEYWDSNRQQSYRVNYSNKIKKNINYTIGAEYTNLSTSEKDSQIFLSVSMPLDIAKRSVNLSYNGIHNRNSDFDAHRVGVSGILGEFDQYSYALNVNHKKIDDTFGAAFNYRATPFLLSTTYSTNFDDRQQYSLQLQGAAVAHKYGITLNNDLGDTFAIVHADGLKGVHLQNVQNVKFDRWGNAIVPYLNPFQYNSVQINANTLPISIDIDAMEIQFVPKKNTSVLTQFKTLNSSKVLIQLKHQSEKIPLGAEVQNSLKDDVAYIGQGQLVFLKNAKVGLYSVMWLKGGCVFEITDDMLNNEEKPFSNLTLECE